MTVKNNSKFQIIQMSLLNSGDQKVITENI